MLILAKAMLAMMIGFVLSIITGLILIPAFKKNNTRQSLSTYLKQKQLIGLFITIMRYITLITIF